MSASLLLQVVSGCKAPRGRGELLSAILFLLVAAGAPATTSVAALDRIDLLQNRLAANSVRDTERVDLGSPDPATQKALRRGWSHRESGWGTSFAWVEGRRAEIVLVSTEGDGAILRVRASPPPGLATPQAMRVRLNGHPVGRVVLEGGWREYRFDVSAPVMRRGRNRLDLLFRRTGAGAKGDPRRLAAAFDVVQLDPHDEWASSAAEVPSLVDPSTDSPLRISPGEGWTWLLRLEPPARLHLRLRCDRGSAEAALALWLGNPATQAEPMLLREDTVCSDGSSTARVLVPLPDDVGPRELTLLQRRFGRAAVFLEEAVLERGRSPARVERPNAVLLILDALRADHVQAYGYQRPTTPWIDRLAAEGLLFENALAQAPMTIASMPSLLTGRYPPSHGVTPSTRLGADIPTWPEVLRDAGYRTVGLSANPFFGEDFGLDRGFQALHPLWLDTAGHRRGLDGVVPAEVVVEATTELLPELREPFLLVVHFLQPHAPYAPPEPFLGAFGPLNEDFDGSEQTLVQASPERKRALLDAAIDRYDENLRYVDDAVGRLTQQLRLLALLDRSVVVVTADHGEQFLERGSYGHPASSLFEESLRVPLIVRLPEGNRRERIVTPVELVDIGPTFLEFAGLSPALASGRSLLSVAPQASAAEAPAFSFATGPGPHGEDPFRWAAARTSRWKLIDRAPEISPQIFDLARDPTESAGSASGDAPLREAMTRARALEQALAELRAELATEARRPPAARLDEPTAARLRALGYLEGMPHPHSGATEIAPVEPVR